MEKGDVGIKITATDEDAKEIMKMDADTTQTPPSGDDSDEVEEVESESDIIVQQQADDEVTPTARNRLLANAAARQHCILYGPPGTGKTHTVNRLTERGEPEEDEESGIVEFTLELPDGSDELWIMKTVQFTPSTDESDLLYGIGINQEGGLENRPGWLVDFNKLLTEREDVDGGLFVIDELSRADVIIAFGQLLTAIEHGGVQLRHSDKSFTLSKKLWIVGTMNTADKSVKQIDIAFRRRFDWIPVLPDYRLISEWSDLIEDDLDCFDKDFKDGFSDHYCCFAEELNESLRTDPAAGPHLQLGHVLFFPMRKLKKAMDSESYISLSDLLEHLRAVLIPQLVHYTGARGVERLQSWITQIVAEKAIMMEYITNKELIGMIKVVSGIEKEVDDTESEEIQKFGSDERTQENAPEEDLNE